MPLLGVNLWSAIGESINARGAPRPAWLGPWLALLRWCPRADPAIPKVRWDIGVKQRHRSRPRSCMNVVEPVPGDSRNVGSGDTTPQTDIRRLRSRTESS